MLPLLWFEGLAPAYGALQALFGLLAYETGARSVSLVFALLSPIHLLPVVAAPPARYPDLYPCLVALAGAGGFGLAFLYAGYRVVAGDGKAKAE